MAEDLIANGTVFRPDFWGRLNPKWNLCSRGRRQSPIDINPQLLLFDPILPPLEIIGHHVNGNLINTGRGIIFKVSGAAKVTAEDPSPPLVLLINGPLSYRYTLNHLTLHYGRDINRGSEHTIDGVQFSGEIQFYAYNSQLYGSWEEAANRAHGIVGVSVLIQTSSDARQANNQLKRITHVLKNITSKGSSQRINSLSIEELLPKLMRRQYITYEGSLTEPACYETVQWIILNKPIYMTSHLFHLLRMSMHDEANHGADNYRPIQKVNGRSIRTNIDFVGDK
ncbi:carbonic anhydrase-related protein 10-like protein, partial [Dinothrombium tinctorium]